MWVDVLPVVCAWCLRNPEETAHMLLSLTKYVKSTILSLNSPHTLCKNKEFIIICIDSIQMRGKTGFNCTLKYLG